MKIRSMTRCAVFTAAMAVCAWLAVPMGQIAVSMQTFAVFLTLGVLGGRLGTVTCLVYLCLGAVGLPVFTGFQGGLGHLLGPAGGYLWGFPVAAAVYWATENYLPRWLGMGLGLLACYGCGVAWYCFAYAEVGLWAGLLTCVGPYIVPDAIKITLALVVTDRLKTTLER